MNKKSFKVSIVIPNWNGEKLMPKHLPSVFKALKNKNNFIKEIIIVDDCSTDNSVKYLKNLQKNEPIKLVIHDKNRGFSHAVNSGVNASSGDLVCLLNTDVSVANNFLEAAVKHFEDKSIFAVSFHEKGYGPAKVFFNNGFFEHSNYGELSKAHLSAWASGGSALFNKSIWQNLGGMDEKILSPFYWEDVDLSYRAYKNGYKVVWEPNSKVDHQHESVINASNFRKKYMSNIKERNQLLLIWKNISDINLIYSHIWGLLKRVAKHPGYIKIFFLAALKIIPVLSYRKKNKKLILTDKEVFSYFK